MISNTTQLKDYFNNRLSDYATNSPSYDPLDVLNLLPVQIKSILIEYMKSLFKGILLGIPEVLDSAISSYKKDISFLIEEKDKKHYFSNELNKLEASHKRNRYSHLFSVDDFHKEIFTDSTIRQVVEELFKIIDEKKYLDISKPNKTNIELFIEDNQREFRYTFLVILKAKVLKLEYNALFSDSNTLSVFPIANKPISIKSDIVSPNPALLKRIDLPSQLATVESGDETEENHTVLHPSHNINYWNKKCYNLFKYFYEFYYLDTRVTNRKLLYMWFYLKELSVEEESGYIFEFTQKLYTEFINREYKVLITNFRKNHNRYLEVDSKILASHRKQFESQYKSS